MDLKINKNDNIHELDGQFGHTYVLKLSHRYTFKIMPTSGEFPQETKNSKQTRSTRNTEALIT